MQFQRTFLALHAHRRCRRESLLNPGTTRLYAADSVSVASEYYHACVRWPFFFGDQQTSSTCGVLAIVRTVSKIAVHACVRRCLHVWVLACVSVSDQLSEECLKLVSICVCACVRTERNGRNGRSGRNGTEGRNGYEL